MKPEKQKDALTDLVEIVSSSDTSDETLSEGEVSTASGDKVTLDFKILAKKLINSFFRKKEMEQKVLENMIDK